MIQVHSCNLLCSSIVMTDGLFKRVSVFVMIPCFLKKWCISFCLLTVLLVFFSSLLPFSKLAELQHHLLSHLLANMIQVFLHSWALCTTVALVVYISPSAKYARTRYLYCDFASDFYPTLSISISNFAYFDCKAIKWVMSFKTAFKDLIYLRNPKPFIVMVTSYYCQKFKDFVVCHPKNKCHFTTEIVSSSLFEISETSI